MWWRRSVLYLYGMVRPGDQEGVGFLLSPVRRGNNGIRAPTQRLLLSTDPTLSAPAIVEAYSGRWTIEPLFRDLKTVDGLGAMWQRGRTTLLRWLHLVQIARTPADRKGRAADPCPDPPRRLAATLTLIKEALAARFRNFEAFRLLPETRRKSGPGRSTGPPAIAVAA
jgi:hypothetical protein